jgi:nucleoside recognition membrane protein YjiH
MGNDVQLEFAAILVSIVAIIASAASTYVVLYVKAQIAPFIERLKLMERDFLEFRDHMKAQTRTFNDHMERLIRLEVGRRDVSDND